MDTPTRCETDPSNKLRHEEIEQSTSEHYTTRECRPFQQCACVFGCDMLGGEPIMSSPQIKQLLYGPARRKRLGAGDDISAAKMEEEQESALLNELAEGDFSADQNIVEVRVCGQSATFGKATLQCFKTRTEVVQLEDTLCTRPVIVAVGVPAFVMIVVAVLGIAFASCSRKGMGM